MCLGRFHVPLRNSKFKILLSIYGSELVSEQARKHQNCLSFSGSSTVTLTFPGRKVPTAAAGGWVPVYDCVHSSVEGCGPSLTPPYCSANSDEVLGAHTSFTFHQWFIWIQHLFHQHLCSAPLGQHQINPPGLSLGFSLFSFPSCSEDWRSCTRRGHQPDPFAGSGRFRQKIDQYKIEIFLRTIALSTKAKLCKEKHSLFQQDGC